MSFADLEAGRPTGVPARRGPSSLSGRGQPDPSQALSSGIFQINTSIATFQRLVNTIGTAKDTPDLREKLNKTRLHIAQLVKDTSAKLKQSSELDHGENVSASKKISDAKLAKDFQAVLKEFQKSQRLAAERETTYAPPAPPSETDFALDPSQEQRVALMESKRQEILHLDNETVFNEAIIEEREQGIKEIQQQIGEVNEIFKDLAVLVNDQGTLIDDIHSNVESSKASVGQAKEHLKESSKSQRSNSSLACLLLVIFAVILLIVIIVLAA